MTHQLFHPHGTHANKNEKDLRLMQELSYHNSLKSEYSSAPLDRPHQRCT